MKRSDKNILLIAEKINETMIMSAVASVLRLLHVTVSFVRRVQMIDLLGQ